MRCSCLQNDDFMMLPVNNVLKDLQSNNELFVNLALSFSGSVAGPEMSAAIAQPVIDVLVRSCLSSPSHRREALACSVSCCGRAHRRVSAAVWSA